VLRSVDAITGDEFGSQIPESSAADVDRLVHAAAAAGVALEAAGRDGRAHLLRAVGERLEERRHEIVATGMRETALPEARLNGELTRTTHQCRLFASVLDDGGYLEATIDHASDTPMGPGPDLRRMLVPIGPVAVFGASNFPLAFSVPGGDTVSALAAGCPVVVKAHDAHLALSTLTASAIRSAARGVGLPEDVIGLVFGIEGGVELVKHPLVRAVGFTGSLTGGKALLDVVNARPEPIPFYGELSSLNPVVVTQAAARERAEEVAEGLVGSVTGSAGQLCTKPGIILVPKGADGDRLVAHAAGKLSEVAPQHPLTDRIRHAYENGVRARCGTSSLVGEGAEPTGRTVSPALFEADAATVGAELLEECFGPLAVVIRYEATQPLDELIHRLPASLTATIQSSGDEVTVVAELARILRPRSGRLVVNGWPTGVLVSWAQHHGGPWPSTNTLHTSVGTTAVRRFLRPFTWQDVPEFVLPEELKDEFSGIPRRVDGVLRA